MKMISGSASSNCIAFLVLGLFAVIGLSLFGAGRNGGEPVLVQGQLNRADLLAGPAVDDKNSAVRSYTFIVKFEPDDVLSGILALYRPDRDRAAQAFLIWTQDKPEFGGLVLDRVSYSGEALLIYDPRRDDRNQLLTLDEIIQLLNASPFVKYAELDSIAQVESEVCQKNCAD